MLNVEIGVGCGSNSPCCQQNVCPRTPDFCIKKNDTKPSFKVSISDCDGVVDLTDESLVLEASMWFNSKLKSNITASETTIFFADNIGLDQVLVGDIVLANKPRNVEKMIVTGVDEENKSITVSRGQYDTDSQNWSKGSDLKIFRFLNLPAQIESVFADVTSTDGTVSEELVDTFFIFNWTSPQTSLSGCYWVEFKLMKINESSEIDWIKSFPISEGFLISVLDSPVTSV